VIAYGFFALGVGIKESWTQGSRGERVSHRAS